MPFDSRKICVDFRNWLMQDSNLRLSDITPIWTTKIKEFFGNYGVGLQYNVKYTSTRKKEYLVDLVWQNDNPDRYIYLALESELSRARVKVGLFEAFSSDVSINIRLFIREEEFYSIGDLDNFIGGICDPSSCTWKCYGFYK